MNCTTECPRCEPWGPGVPGKAKCIREVDTSNPVCPTTRFVSVVLGKRCQFPNEQASLFDEEGRA